MKQFIRYLYEYDHGKRTRNIGFVKVEQGSAESTIHIHAKGLWTTGGENFKVYLLCEEDGRLAAIPQGEISYMGAGLNYRLRYTDEDTGTPENYDDIRGILLEGTKGRRFAAVWEETSDNLENVQLWSSNGDARAEASGETGDMPQETAVEPGGAEETGEMPEEQEDYAEGRNMPGDISFGTAAMRKSMPPQAETWQEEPRQIREPDADAEPDAAPEQDTVPVPEQNTILEPEAGGEPDTAPGQNTMPEPNTTWGQNTMQEPDTVPGQNTMLEPDTVPEQNAAPEPDKIAESDAAPDVTAQTGMYLPRWKTTKIQRNEINILPRCEWRLANNNFLLHGYYNYHHLIFLDDGKRLKLGVPGIYHEREAKAAESFGFPEFIEASETGLSLGKDECSRDAQFGYWCRQVRRPPL